MIGYSAQEPVLRATQNIRSDNNFSQYYYTASFIHLTVVTDNSTVHASIQQRLGGIWSLERPTEFLAIVPMYCFGGNVLVESVAAQLASEATLLLSTERDIVV